MIGENQDKVGGKVSRVINRGATPLSKKTRTQFCKGGVGPQGTMAIDRPNRAVLQKHYRTERIRRGNADGSTFGTSPKKHKSITGSIKGLQFQP